MAETALRAEAPAPQYGPVPPSVQVSELSRHFGDITAVDGISFEVGEAEIFGFLGPNGAGKTTTISMLCTLLTPTAGRATIGGHDIVDDPGGVRREIGIVFQDSTVDERLTARENLVFHGELFGMGKQDIRPAPSSSWSASACSIAPTTPSSPSPAACAGGWRWPAA